MSGPIPLPWTTPLMRSAMSEKLKSILDESAEYFAHRDMNNFWRTWNAKYNKRTSVHEICIDGNTAADKIADSLRQYYANIYMLTLLKINVKLRNLINIVCTMLVIQTIHL